MDQAVNGDAFALEVAEVLRIGGDFDGDELVGPDMMMARPDFAERSAADLASRTYSPTRCPG